MEESILILILQIILIELLMKRVLMLRKKLLSCRKTCGNFQTLRRLFMRRLWVDEDERREVDEIDRMNNRCCRMNKRRTVGVEILLELMDRMSLLHQFHHDKKAVKNK